jgi:tripartite-type tricarboxylate transporter receptor subunit TctC
MIGGLTARAQPPSARGPHVAAAGLVKRNRRGLASTIGERRHAHRLLVRGPMTTRRVAARRFATWVAAAGALLFAALPAIAQQYPTRPIAVFSEARSPLLPAVPTLKESNVDLVINIHTGVFVPKATPDAIVARLSAAFATSAQAPAFKTFGGQSWVEPFYRPTDAFATAIEPEKTMYTQVIARLGTR